MGNVILFIGLSFILLAASAHGRHVPAGGGDTGCEYIADGGRVVSYGCSGGDNGLIMRCPMSGCNQSGPRNRAVNICYQDVYCSANSNFLQDDEIVTKLDSLSREHGFDTKDELTNFGLQFQCVAREDGSCPSIKECLLDTEVDTILQHVDIDSLPSTTNQLERAGGAAR